jgi:hypothetical protein
MQRFCFQHQGSSIIDVHQSFNNFDKITALIRKQRLLSYSLGQSIAAVENNFKIYSGMPDQVRF